jgi:hypothetical protein
MPRHLVSTGSPFQQAAGYSHAVIDDGMAFVSGNPEMKIEIEVTAKRRSA